MRCKVTITGYYEVPPKKFFEAYGTHKAEEAVAIDAQNEPAEMLEYCKDVTMHIEIVH